MMYLRSILFAMASFAVAAVPAGAQQSGSVPVQQPAHHRSGFMRMLHSLNLSDAQKAQIKTAMQNYRAQHPRGSTPDPQARKQLRRQLLALLTPQQRAQFRSEMQARKLHSPR